MVSNLKINELNDLTKNLCNVLDKEFEFLKSQNIDNFLNIQDQKEKLLADLSQTIIDLDLSASQTKNQPQFDEFLQTFKIVKKLKKEIQFLFPEKLMPLGVL